MNKIKRNDDVIVISGKDKHKKGKVIKVLPNDRLLVSGVNLVKKHIKPNPNLNKPGGILEKEASIHISNVAIFNLEANKKDDISFIIENGNKVRVFKSNNERIN